MIIESGIDVVQVLCGSVGDGTPVGLWIVAADEDLRLLSVEPVPLRGVGGDYPGVRASDSLIARLDAVEEMLLDSPRIAYFALAWSSDTDLERDSTWLRDLDSDMRERPELSAARLLGLVVFDPTTVFASLPRCDFSLDRDFHDLPRAVAVAGPHGRACPCPACSADRRSYDDYEGQGYGGRGYEERGYDDSLYDDTLYDDPSYDAFSNRWYPEPDRAHKRWTNDEEHTITQSHFAGLSCFDISMLVRRQPGAVASRLNKLGISSRTYVPERDSPVSALSDSSEPVSPPLTPPGQSPPAR